MGRYLIRRVLFMGLVLFVVSLLTFLIFVKLPAANPAIRAVGRATTPANIRAATHALGLDRPVWVQYWRFAKGLIPWPGFFLNRQVYFSYTNFVPVSSQIYSRLPDTATLGLGAAGLWLLIGIPIGIVSAVRRRSITDRAAMVFALIGVSAPVFWLAYLFLYLFWFKLRWFPPSGFRIGESVLHAMFRGVFWLPWLALSLTFA